MRLKNSIEPNHRSIKKRIHRLCVICRRKFSPDPKFYVLVDETRIRYCPNCLTDLVKEGRLTRRWARSMP